MKQQMVFQRFELKYLLTETQLREVLAAMAPHMEPDEYPHSSIRSLYLDTPDFRLVRRTWKSRSTRKNCACAATAGPPGRIRCSRN